MPAIAANYDLYMTLIIFITSLAIYMTSGNILIIALSGICTLSTAIYCHYSTEFLIACETTKKADRLKSISDIVRWSMWIFFVIELISYGVQYGL